MKRAMSKESKKLRSKKQRILREAIDETVDPGKLDAEEVQNEADEAWAVMVAGLASGQTSQERKTLEDFDDLVGTPYYWEAVVRAGICRKKNAQMSYSWKVKEHYQ
jgi:predicted transcriptional regulator